jgi:hypothetical protein
MFAISASRERTSYNFIVRVMRNLPLTDAQRLSADTTVAALETFIDRGTNKRVYRCRLAGRQRDPNEPLEDFLVAIKDLAVPCKYTAAADDNTAGQNRVVAAAGMVAAHDTKSTFQSFFSNSNTGLGFQGFQEPVWWDWTSPRPP